MKADGNRLGRKDRLRRRRATGERPRRHARWAALFLTGAAIALAAAPARAATGGISTDASSAAAASDGEWTGRGIAFAPLRIAGATWYGPGLYGNRTACGQVLRPRTVGVAHRRLPCGTPVKFEHRGRRIVARVIDRGPFTPGMTWDLTNGARKALRFGGAGPIRYAVGLRYAKRRSVARRAGARSAD